MAFGVTLPILSELSEGDFLSPLFLKDFALCVELCLTVLFVLGRRLPPQLGSVCCRVCVHC